MAGGSKIYLGRHAFNIAVSRALKNHLLEILPTIIFVLIERDPLKFVVR